MKALVFNILTAVSGALLLAHTAMAIEGQQSTTDGERAGQVIENNGGKSTLTGDWGGLRSRWAEQGVNFEAVYTGDVMSNRSGGVKRGTEYLDNTDLMLTLDGEKLLGRHGLTLFLYGIVNNGNSPTDNVGDLQGVDNIDAPTTSKLLEAWVEQSLCQDSCSVKAGLYNLNSEFDAIDTATLFINSSHGVGPDYSQTGQNGPSIFPSTSVAVRISYKPTAQSYIQAAALDGVPGDPSNPHGTQIEFNSGDGALLAAEAGLRFPGASEDALGARYSLGVWHYTAHFDDLVDTDGAGQPLRRDNNQGAYVIAEGTLYNEPDDATQGLAVYGRYGIANDDINTLRDYLGAGVVYTGLIPGRPQDKLGLAAADARTGNKYRSAMQLAGTPTTAGELAVELTYHAELTAWLSMQPDVQYIVDPGADPTLENALLLGLRVVVAL